MTHAKPRRTKNSSTLTPLIEIWAHIDDAVLSVTRTRTQRSNTSRASTFLAADPYG